MNASHRSHRPPSFDFPGRISRLQRMLARKRVDACILASSHDIDAATYYFSGDSTTPTMLFITPQFSAIASLHEKDFAHLFNECIPLSVARKRMRALLAQHRVKRLAVDDSSDAAGLSLRMKKRRPSLSIEPISEELSRMRNVKEPSELECIAHAQKLTVDALEWLEERYHAGMLWGKTENAVAGELEKRARESGASLDAFSPMVLAGERSAFFHNPPSNTVISPSQLLLSDIGARYENYCGDATRTWYAGKDKRLKDAIEFVRQSKHAAEKKVRVGVKGRELSDAALNVLVEAGYKKHSFRAAGLSLGHFVGLRVHDGTSMEKERLTAGMAFTIEPGIYIPGEFGVRIEDVVLLRD